MTPKAYYLNSYTANAWTDLIGTTTKATVVKSIAITVGSTAGAISLQVTDGSNTEKMLLVNAAALEAAATHTPDLAAIVLNIGEKLRVKFSVGGAAFAAFGADS